MKFIDFLKDRLSYIIVYFISVSLAVLVMYLTISIKIIEFPLINVLYVYLLSIVILVIFILYKYFKIRSFYNHLNNILNSENIIDDVIINHSLCSTLEQKLFSDVLKKVHKDYKNNIDRYEVAKMKYSAFISQWVHQMKTPVSVINLLLQEECIKDCREVFDSIAEENEKISQGLNIMMYNSRLNEFNHDFNVKDIDILLILRKVINDNKKLIIRNKIFPEIIGESTIVHTDKKWMYFVINQIVINAVKYTAISEQNKKTIKFIIKDQDTKVIVLIKDNGIGIPKEDVGRIFDEFFTGKNGRKTSESTGMGLYLAKRICSEMGNDLEVKSEEGKGAEFFITFYKGKNIFKM